MQQVPQAGWLPQRQFQAGDTHRNAQAVAHDPKRCSLDELSFILKVPSPGEKQMNRSDANMKKQKTIAFSVILPIALGTVNYLFYRNPNVVLFQWIDSLELLPFAMLVRQMIDRFISPPDWFIFNLPAALWTYSFTSVLFLIWGSETKSRAFFPFLIPIVLALFSEILQLLIIIPGTFDIIDVIFYGLGSIIAVLQFNKSNRKRRIYEN